MAGTVRGLVNPALRARRPTADEILVNLGRGHKLHLCAGGGPDEASDLTMTMSIPFRFYVRDGRSKTAVQPS